MADLEVVVRLLAAIDEAEKPELEARGDHELLWTMGDTADAWHVECRHCGDWTAEGPEGVVNPLADEHARRCVSMPTSDVLRLCQSHRDIVARHSPVTIQVHDPDKYGHTSPTDSADELACRRCGTPSEYPVPWPCADLIDLARGYGVEES